MSSLLVSVRKMNKAKKNKNIMEVFEEKKTVSGRKTWTTVDLSAHKEINASGPVSGYPCITHPKARI